MSLPDLVARDETFATITSSVELPAIPPSQGVFYDLVSCIVDQQIPHRSRGVFMKKVISLLKGDEPTSQNVFQIREDEWSRNKLAAHKYQTLLRLADHWNENNWNELDWDAHTDQEIRALLTSIKGIGPQTADLILLYSLQRPDVFPVNDYHLKIIMSKVYELDPDQKIPPQLLEIAEQWKPHRSIGTRYLLAYKEMLNKKM